MYLLLLHLLVWVWSWVGRNVNKTAPSQGTKNLCQHHSRVRYKAKIAPGHRSGHARAGTLVVDTSQMGTFSYYSEVANLGDNDAGFMPAIPHLPVVMSRPTYQLLSRVC
jgi:hypothetical protein